MVNTLNNSRNPVVMSLSDSDYWDHCLYYGKSYDGILYMNDDTECLSVYIDTDSSECLHYDGDKLVEISSLSDYTWSNAVNNGIVLDNIGITGMDNGLIVFDKSSITDDEFRELFTNSKLEIHEGDLVLHADKVDGNINGLFYGCEPYDDDDIRTIKLNGGFFQGFFKTGNGCDFMVLPDRIENGWTVEFTLKPDSSVSVEGADTLNDYIKRKYPESDNYGTFFYIGTRAENKWSRYYTDTNAKSDYETYGGIPVDERINEINTNNRFITYNRTDSGHKAPYGLNEDTYDKISFRNRNYDGNMFVTMNRGENGITADTITDGDYKTTYDILDDLYHNALSFQIKTDGSIGYKYLTEKCDEETGKSYEILSEFSNENCVEEGKWSTITVRMTRIAYMNEYGIANDKMRLMFYVNGKLVLYSKELPVLNLRQLDDIYDKQESVPYNISIGGGTQGLCETVYDDYKEKPEHPCYLEKEFSGTFIGYFKSFRFYDCDKNYNSINAITAHELKNL